MNRRDLRNAAISYFILLFLGILLFHHAQYGFIWGDEPHYFAVAYRFLQGDVPFLDDWHLSQIYSILLVPYVGLYKWIAGSFDGILLFSRYLYVILQTLMAMLIFRFLFRKERNMLASLIPACMFLIFCRANIQTISYYSASAFCFTGACLLTADGSSGSHQRQTKCLMFYFSGILFGLCVFCNPMLLIAIAVMLIHLRKDRSAWLWMLLGGLTVAAIVCAAVLPRFDFSLFRQYLPEILSTDNGKYEGSKLITLLKVQAWAFKNSRWTLSLFIVLGLAELLLRKKGSLNTTWKRTCCFLNGIILILSFFFTNRSVYWSGISLFAGFLSGIDLMLLSEKREREFCFDTIIMGILAALCWSVTSDTGFSAALIGYLTASIGALYEGIRNLTDLFQDSERGLQRGLVLSALFAVVLVPADMLRERLSLFYRDASDNQLTEQITRGPGKGIFTTSDCVRRYEDIMDSLEPLQGKEGTLYISGFCPWGYLCTDLRVGSFTTYRIISDEENEKLKRYYETHPGKQPDYVLALNACDDEYDGKNFSECSYDPERYPIFSELVDQGAYSSEKVQAGYLMQFTGKKKNLQK